jgi:hypothetical protein
VAPFFTLQAQFDLPTRFLDGGVQLPDLLRQVVHLLLQGRHVHHGDPVDLFHPVAIRWLRANVNDALQNAVSEVTDQPVPETAFAEDFFARP